MQMRERKFNVCIIRSSKELLLEGNKNKISVALEDMEGDICLSDFVV